MSKTNLIYVASSWRNTYQQSIVELLRSKHYEVYDFKNPGEGNRGFKWSEIDLQWEVWTIEEYRDNLKHKISQEGFKLDFDAMKSADQCVLVLPSGRSSHLEAGYFWGAGKPLHILLISPMEPELMYLGATSVNINIEELFRSLKETATIDCPNCDDGTTGFDVVNNCLVHCHVCNGTARVEGITTKKE